MTAAEPCPYDTPPWRNSHTAASPDGATIAVIEEAFEHSMGNPTVGTLRTSDGLELTKCNPAFLWSDDSRYLAVPRWCRRFGLFRRQRLALVDLAARVVYVSRFTQWLLLPTRFAGGELEVRVSDPRGIGLPWRERPMLLAVPSAFSKFTKMSGVYG